MKATIHIECTPAEARACFGLPDMQPMQAAVMDRLQERMMSEMDRFSPEATVCVRTPQPRQVTGWIYVSMPGRTNLDKRELKLAPVEHRDPARALLALHRGAAHQFADQPGMARGNDRRCHVCGSSLYRW